MCKLSLVTRSDYMADSRFAPSQWETALFCNDVSHCLGASLESALGLYSQFSSTVPLQHCHFFFPKYSLLHGVFLGELKSNLASTVVVVAICNIAFYWAVLYRHSVLLQSLFAATSIKWTCVDFRSMCVFIFTYRKNIYLHNHMNHSRPMKIGFSTIFVGNLYTMIIHTKTN